MPTYLRKGSRSWELSPSNKTLGQIMELCDVVFVEGDGTDKSQVQIDIVIKEMKPVAPAISDQNAQGHKYPPTEENSSSDSLDAAK
ncbi:hypothetical protein M404DRAFT_33331 [Pisolithus tinctorius Marx 270]|uniref:Uncharacterized protein n=1 Tax=Pisolithus tinctorius Marx 270 TaxID=870435 RepID=A0A0C3NM57_PISTI|nr:hypothetical protein M404DRAFT_33331 [Pisolithus tinctorius Marx 270]